VAIGPAGITDPYCCIIDI